MVALRLIYNNKFFEGGDFFGSLPKYRNFVIGNRFV